MDSLAITDHGAMYGAMEFYQAAREAGVNPILGCEFYFTRFGYRSRDPADKNPYHLTLLARNGEAIKTCFNSAPSPISRASTIGPGWIGSFLRSTMRDWWHSQGASRARSRDCC